jgi:hypothetical protein
VEQNVDPKPKKIHLPGDDGQVAVAADTFFVVRKFRTIILILSDCRNRAICPVDCNTATRRVERLPARGERSLAARLSPLPCGAPQSVWNHLPEGISHSRSYTILKQFHVPQAGVTSL